MASQLVVQPLARAIRGSVPVSGDQEIALCRIALAACSRGRASLDFPGQQGGVLRLLKFLDLLGVHSEWEGARLHVHGLGLAEAKALTEAVDLRGDAPLAGLALGLLVSRSFPSELLVDDVVVQLLVPALQEVHQIDVAQLPDGGFRVALGQYDGGERPQGLSVLTHGVYPWIKQAILLAGLRAGGPTVVEERLASADHLERAMTRARMPIEANGTIISLHPPRDADAVAPQIYEHVGSYSLAWPLAVAGLMTPGSELTLREIGLNPTRSDFIGLLRLLGAEVGVTPRGDRQGEPYGNFFLRAGDLSAIRVGGESAIRLGDGATLLLAAAARAEGESMLTDLVASSRGADPQIWGRAAGLVRSAGALAEVTGSGLRIQGLAGKAFDPLTTTTGGDSRLALLATVLALGAKGQSVIDDVDCLVEDFPRWAGTLRALGATIEVRSS